MADQAPASPSGALRVALLGCGIVGSQVVRLLTEHNGELAARVGAPLELVGVAVRDASLPRQGVAAHLLTTDAAALVTRADIVIEVMGGIEPARALVLAAIASGASVVTANKALLATHGPELYEAADAGGVDICYEAAVAGAVPVVRGVRTSLAGDRVHKVLGIVNGTTNFILDQMTTEGLDFDKALAQAQELGYAEADPTADIDGHDAAAKAAILASLAFHTRVRLDDVRTEGVRGLDVADIRAAAETGHVVKLVAIAERLPSEAIAVRVHPALIGAEHPLATVRGAFNAVVVESEAAGRLMFYGQGAGGAPTASAVLGDVVAVARHRVLGGKSPSESAHAELPIAGPEVIQARFQIRMRVADAPGVLEQIAGTVAQHGVSIEAVRQHGLAGASDGGSASLVVVTHSASEKALQAVVADLAAIRPVQAVESVLRVEGD